MFVTDFGKTRFYLDGSLTRRELNGDNEFE